MLRRWRRRQKEDIGLVEYVFTTTKGDQLQPANVRNMVYNYAEKAGITEKSVSPHTPATPSPPTSTARPKIFVWCRKPWATLISAPPRSTPI